MRRIILFVYLLLGYAIFPAQGLADDDLWLLIDTKTLKLEVIQGNETIFVIKDISIGRNGSGVKQHSGDAITPKGTYKISWINNQSPFYRFFGFNYPSIKDADEALLAGLISKKAHTSIVTAHIKKIIPPQNTAIGGRIGIHGLGDADKSIHKMMNWTKGCIALTNDQIDQLGRWIKNGIVVKIK